MPKRTESDDGPPAFAGFTRPESNYFRLPVEWIDITAGIKNIAELKVVQYVLRHTWGFQEYGVKKHITIDEFVAGRRRKDGSRMDRGTGLSERAVRYGLDDALAHGFLEEERDESDKARVKRLFSLRMQDGWPSGEATTLNVDTTDSHRRDLPAEVQSLHPGVQSVQGRGAKFAPRTEIDTLEQTSSKSSMLLTNSNPTADRSKFRKGSHRNDGNERGMESRRPSTPAVEQQRLPIPAERRAAAAQSASARSADDATTARGLTRLSTVLRERGILPAPEISVDRSTVPTAAPRTRPARRSQLQSEVPHEAQEVLRTYLSQYAEEFHDQAKFASSMTRVLGYYRDAGLTLSAFTSRMEAARRRTKADVSASRIRKQGSAFAYFLALVEEEVGLRMLPPQPATADEPTTDPADDPPARPSLAGKYARYVRR